jgi:hypothetical protein
MEPFDTCCFVGKTPNDRPFSASTIHAKKEPITLNAQKYGFFSNSTTYSKEQRVISCEKK